MTDLELFDANCYIGRYRSYRPGTFYKRSGLLAQMDYYGIRQALAVHSLSREHNPADGNDAAVAELHGQDRVHPVWAMLPPASRELPAPDVLVPNMIASGVKAARFFYGSYHFPLAEWCIGQILDVLEDYLVPTFIDPDPETDTMASDLMDWDGVDSLCRAHPLLPVVLSEVHFFSSNRLLYQLFERHANLRVELSGLWGHRNIEFITREFGANRILFGSGMPLRDPGGAIAQLTYAEISDEDRQLIGSGNLTQLVEAIIK